MLNDVTKVAESPWFAQQPQEVRSHVANELLTTARKQLDPQTPEHEQAFSDLADYVHGAAKGSALSRAGTAAWEGIKEVPGMIAGMAKTGAVAGLSAMDSGARLLGAVTGDKQAFNKDTQGADTTLGTEFANSFLAQSGQRATGAVNKIASYIGGPMKAKADAVEQMARRVRCRRHAARRASGCHRRVAHANQTTPICRPRVRNPSPW